MTTIRNLPDFAVRLMAAVFMAAMVLAIPSQPVHAAEAAEIDAAVDAGLQKLFAEVPETRALAETSAGVLVFPSITKAGLVAGVAGGRGALRVAGKTAGYYRSRAVSYGLQAGIENFGYALFLVSDADLQTLQQNGGSFAVGASPSLVIADKGFVKSIGTQTLKKGIIAFFFSEEGLMVGGGLQATKITQIYPN